MDVRTAQPIGKAFTGHEMLDSVSLVHMNGRVYDPYLARFISADTIISNLAASQSVNPYSYAWNDPLRYVDPSGHGFMDTLYEIFVVIMSVAIGYGLGGAIGGFGGAFFGGFVGGYVGATMLGAGSSAALTAGLLAGLTAGLFHEVGEFAQTAAKKGAAWTKSDKVLAHAGVGCVVSMASGGNCGQGAASAALSEAAVQGGYINPNASGFWGTIKAVVEAGIVGGVAARITGGNFNDGFSVAAAGYLFNSALHADNGVIRGEKTIQCVNAYDDECGMIVKKANQSNAMFDDGTGIDVHYSRYDPHSSAPPDFVFHVVEFIPATDGREVYGLAPFASGIQIERRMLATGVVGHEIGHIYLDWQNGGGIYHPDRLESIMYPYWTPAVGSHFDKIDVQYLLRALGQ